MHRINKRFGMFGINMLMYAVTKIENMAAPITITFKNGGDFLTNAFG